MADQWHSVDGSVNAVTGTTTGIYYFLSGFLQQLILRDADSALANKLSCCGQAANVEARMIDLAP